MMILTKKTVLTGVIAVILCVVKPSSQLNVEQRSGHGGLVDVDDVTFKNAAVTSNGQECAAIGSNTLQKGGSVADAAIATLFCEGVTCSQCMGLGGGFLLTMYLKDQDRVFTLDSREVAPAAAHENMFQGKTKSSKTGGLSVAVPGELRGYEMLHKKYGKLPWAELIQPAIDLCREGHVVTYYLAMELKDKEQKIKNEPSMSDYINPETNNVWLEGDKLKRLKLAKTLETIAKEGVDALYNGSLTQSFLADIKAHGGIITAEDMLNYRPIWREPIAVELGGDMTLHTVPLPSTGHILTFIINALKGWVFSSEPSPLVENSLPYWQRIMEVFKYAFAKRTGLGDADYLDPDDINPLLSNLTSTDFAAYIQGLISDTHTSNNWTDYGAEFNLIEDHGTAHVSLVAPNGDAISVTSTVNYIFGAFFISNSTGILLNNEMDDFSYPNISNVYGLPPSPANFPKPGKRPLSSMVPSIVVAKGKGARLLVGAAGGTKTTTLVSMVVLKHLLSGVSLDEAINSPRVHHQLLPMEIEHEVGFDEDILQGLRKIGHKTSQLSPTSGFASVTAISVDPVNGFLTPRYDKRRTGSVAGF